MMFMHGAVHGFVLMRAICMHAAKYPQVKSDMSERTRVKTGSFSMSVMLLKTERKNNHGLP